MVSLVDPVGNETQWTYDAYGRETLMTDPRGGEVVKTYDSASRVASILNRNDKLRTFEYDDAGRLIEEVLYDGTTTAAAVVQTLTWDYDDDGLLLEASKTDGTNTFTYSYQYDSSGRVIHVDEPFGVGLDFGYDENELRNLVKDSLGGEERSVHNASGQLLSRTLKQGGTYLRIDFTYTASGQVEAQLRYNDLTATTLIAKTTNSYDSAGRLTKIETKDGSNTLIDSFEYAYDAAGQITSRIDVQPGISSGSPRTTLYDYDDQGQLTQDGGTDYEYDANGNRDGYTYDSTYTNQIENDGVWDYTYDAEGNVTDKISTALDIHWHYTCDHANQLTEARKYDYDASGPEQLLMEADYTYDVYGGRVRKIVDIDGAGIGPAATTRFALDKWNNTKLMPIGTENTDVWADLDGSNSLQARYFRGDFVDQILGRIEGSNRYWLLADHLSSVRDVITTGGVESIDYDAWGNILQDDASRGRYGWTGREYDVEADLQFNRARYYDASTGRWISQDPLSFDAGDGNLYRYSRNSITTTSDPSGLLIKSITLDGLDEAIKTMREDPILAKAMFPGFNSQYKHIPAEVKSVDEIALVQPVLFYIKKHDEASSVSQGGFFTTMRIALENQIPDPLDDGWVFISVQARRYNDDRRRVETKETLTALGVRQGKLVGNSDLLLEYNGDRVEALPGVAPLQGGEVTLSLQVGFGILKDAAARRQRQKWNPFNNANPIARRLIDGGVRDDVDWLQPVQGGVSFAFDQKVITRFRFRIKDTNFDILAPQA